MSIARWWADPSWIPNSFLLSDAAGTRIGLNAIMSPFWNMASFETVAMTATFINLFIIGGLLFLIAKEIRKPSIIFMILMHLTMFSGLGDKSFYSGEWIFGGAEPKTFCYIFSLWGILLFMRKKYVWTFLLLAVAAYFHVLIAGWILLILLIDNLFQDGIKVTFKNGVIFVIGILPLFFYLLNSWFQKGASSYAGGSSDIFISNIHSHLKPWLVEGREYRFYGGLFYAFVAAAIAFYRHKKVDKNTALLYRLSIYAFAIPAFLAIFAPWDWFEPILMTFPFRLTMMQKILFYIPVVMEISGKLENLQWKKQITAGLVIILIVSGALRLNKNIIQRWSNYQDENLLKISEILVKNYEPGVRVFYLHAKTRKPDDKLDPLQRKARANVYFSNKFLPFSPERMLEWERRKLLTEEIRADLSKIELLKNENIEVVISKEVLPLELVAEVSEYKIYNFKL